MDERENGMCGNGVRHQIPADDALKTMPGNR